jgi:hypothetical protein
VVWCEYGEESIAIYSRFETKITSGPFSHGWSGYDIACDGSTGGGGNG